MPGETGTIIELQRNGGYPVSTGEDPRASMHGAPEHYLIGKNDDLRMMTAEKD